MNCLDREIWKDISEYEGLYQVSSYGNVRSVDRVVLAKNGREMTFKGRLLTPNTDGARGYLKVGLCKNNKTTTFRIHALVAKAFLENEGECVNHIDGNKLNNHLSNLEWTSYSNNNSHAYDNGLKPNKCKKFIAISPTGEQFIYEKQSDCSKETGVSTAYISMCLSGKYKQAKGWIFKGFRCDKNASECTLEDIFS